MALERASEKQAFDPLAPFDIECGTLMPVRASRLATIYDYKHDTVHAPLSAENKQFAFDLIVITTRGSWQLHGSGGRSEIGSASLVLGATGHGYGCRHDHDVGDSNLIIGLRPGSLDGEWPQLFRKQIVPAAGALNLVGRAIRSTSDDCFDSLIFTLFDEASARSCQSMKKRASRFRALRTKRFIELHAFEPITLADIALELGVSQFTCIREYRRFTGMTPHGYLLHLRLARAKQLLKESTLSIEMVGRNAGFGDLAYFSRFFKQGTGYAPSSYRAMLF